MRIQQAPRFFDRRLIFAYSHGSNPVNAILSSPVSYLTGILEVEKLMRRYTRVPMSLADACFVRMSEVFSNSTVLTFNRHFRTYRRRGRQIIAMAMPLSRQAAAFAKPTVYGYLQGVNLCIFLCMRTTLNIDDDLLASARRYTGESEKTALVRMGLHALIEREAARRLARLGGSMPKLKIKRRARSR